MGRDLPRGPHLLTAPHIGDAWPRGIPPQLGGRHDFYCRAPIPGQPGIRVGPPDNGLRDWRKSQGIKNDYKKEGRKQQDKETKVKL